MSAPPQDAASPSDRDTAQMQLEASTMALYVSVVLLAALVALRDTALVGQAALLEVIWGTTLGLALTHLYAFRVSSRLVRGRSFDREDLRAAVAQLAGAAAVAAICTLVIVPMPQASEGNSVRLLLAVLMGSAGYTSGRSGGASRLRSVALGAWVLLVGFAVAIVKNAL